MVETKNNFLPHLENSIPEGVSGYSIGMYSVALEGWRRGMTLKFINNNKRKSELDYSLTYNGKECRFSVTRGDAVPRSAIRACINKEATKEYLMKAGVPTPKGQKFGKEVSDEEIIDYANELGYPVVLKPSNGTGGVGVIANIKNENELNKALSYTKYELKFTELIVEEYTPGEDYRIYVIDKRVIGALKKIPANIIGDGKSTIKKLIEQKNTKRKEVPALSDKPIKIDNETHNLLSSLGYNLDSVPEKGERVFLKTKNNISSGGDSVDVTDSLSEEVSEIAINAARSIPGLVQCGIDLMVDETKKTGYILEVNSRPHINSQLFPMEGKARDIPKAIIDYYFPESIQYDYSQEPSFYFDFKSMFDAFRKGHCKEFIIPDRPKGDLTATRFIITGTIDRIKFEKRIRKHVFNLKLNGSMKYLKNGEISLVVSGPTESINKIRQILNNNMEYANINKVLEKSRTKPVKIGFEIKGIVNFRKEERKPSLEDGYHPVYMDGTAVKDVKNTDSKGIPSLKGEQTPAEISRMEKELNNYKRKYDDIINSSSWKITSPIRKIGIIIKSIVKH